MNRHEKWMKTTLKISEKSPYEGRTKICAIVVSGGSVISVGFNKRKTHPYKIKYNLCKKNKYTKSYENNIHAEIDALLGLSNKDLKKSTIYIAGLTNKGSFLLTKPCASCKSIIAHLGIKNVYYQTKKGEVKKLKD